MTEPIPVVLIALLGACMGSLLNVVVWRLPQMIMQQDACRLTLWLPPSHCPHCQHNLAWYDNIPLVSWLWLHGRCRYCSGAISARYPLTELASALLFLLPGTLFSPGLTLVACWILGWLLLALVLIDMKHLLLPDSLTQPLLWLGMLYPLVNPLSLVTLQQSLIGAVSGYMALWLLAKGYACFRDRDALGMGDAKLLAALGAWLGWQPLPLLLLLASAISVLSLLISHLLTGRTLTAPFPFGPGLAVAGFGLFLVSSLG